MLCSLQSLRDVNFKEAIETLQHIKTKFTPFDKIGVVVDTVRHINKSIVDHFWSMDELFPGNWLCHHNVILKKLITLTIVIVGEGGRVVSLPIFWKESSNSDVIVVMTSSLLNAGTSNLDLDATSLLRCTYPNISLA